MISSTNLRLSALAITLASLAGCGTPPVVSGCVTYEHQQNTAALATSMLSPELARMIGVRDTSSDVTGTGLAKIQATVYNCTDVDVTVLMRTRFFGDRGPAEPVSAWRTIMLAPRSEATYVENAVSSSARKMTIEIYDAQRAQQPYVPGQSYSPLSPALTR